MNKLNVKPDPKTSDVCDSCGEGLTLSEYQCKNSKRACGHHCNHSFTLDACCWCGEEFGESDE
jgi:hypothetical protein